MLFCLPNAKTGMVILKIREPEYNVICLNNVVSVKGFWQKALRIVDIS